MCGAALAPGVPQSTMLIVLLPSMSPPSAAFRAISCGEGRNLPWNANGLSSPQGIIRKGLAAFPAAEHQKNLRFPPPGKADSRRGHR